MRPSYQRYVTLVFLFLSCGIVILQGPIPQVLAQTPQAESSPAVLSGTMTKEQASQALAASQNDLKAIPADIPENRPEGQRRAVLQRRVALLEEYLGLLVKAAALVEQKQGLGKRLQQAKAQLPRLEQEAAPAPPESPSKEAFEKFTATVAAQRDQVSALRNTISDRNQWLESSPRLLNSVRERAEEAEKRAGRLAEESAAETTEAGKKLLALRLDNARFDKQVALKTVEALQREADLEKALEPVRSAELELAEKRLERLEQAFALYSKALEQQLALEQRRQEEDLARKQQEAVTATTPAERFVAAWEAELSRSHKNKGELETFLVGLKRDAAETEKRLAAEKEELIGFREFLKRTGISGKAADRIKLMLRQLKLRRRLLNRPIRPNFPQTLNAYRERRFEIEDLLFTLTERWNEGRNAVLSPLPETEQAVFKARTANVLASYRTALRDEKTLLTEVITLGQEAQIVSGQRLDTLNELERFIRSRAFWLQDGKPLGIEAVRPIGQELRKLAAWRQQLGSKDVTSRLTDILRRPMSIVYGLLLFLALPVLLVYGRQRLRRATRSRNLLSLEQTSTFRDRFMTILTGTLSAALIPAYVLLMAGFIGVADLPPVLRPVLSQGLGHMAYFLFFWFLTRVFCNDRGILRAQFDLHADAVRVLYGSLRLILLSYVTWLLLWRLLSRPPFELESLPRLCYTLFELAVALAIIRLIRLKSPFVQHCLTADASNVVARHWPLISALLSLLIIAIMALDVAGYRYAARGLTRSFTLSLITLIGLPILYRGVTSAIQSVARRRRHATMTAAPGEEPEPTENVEQQVHRFVRVVFVLLVIFLLAGYWGIDQQAFKTLDEIHIYSVRGVGDAVEFVTMADMVRAVLFLVVTFWLLRGLPGIYEFAVLPRLRLDEGMKYAVLTLSRYTIFMIGILLTLSEVHLDLGRLGWLMAAVGVGLGFGLQEIVSNFVSGIILLVERPIQVNDVVTVGTMSGTVRRINIRATTIVNFDRQEVILPNRRLITSEVTNWTRGDTIMRLVISIGVAYGSNVDEVSELLLQIARQQAEVLQDPAPSVIFMQHGESALEFQLRVFIPAPSVRMLVQDRINKAINRAFAERGISIPFPQRDLHIKSSVVNMDDVVRMGQGDASGDFRTPERSE